MKIWPLLLLTCFISLNAQTAYTPAKYKYKGKEYNVYPFRMSGKEDIPPCAFSLPDGDYILFHDYIFRQKNYFDKAKLVDSLKVSALFSIKNNKPEGAVQFFQYYFKEDGTLSRRKKVITTGYYKEGLQDGYWLTLDHEDKRKTEQHFKSGLRHGAYRNYLNKLPDVFRKYRNDSLVDTVFTFHRNGKLASVYDVLTKESEGSTQSPRNFHRFFLETEARRYLWGKGVLTFLKHYAEDGSLLLNANVMPGYGLYFDTVTIEKTTFRIIRQSDSVYLVQAINLPPGILPVEEYYKNNFCFRKKTYLFDRNYYDIEFFGADTLTGPPSLDTVIAVFSNEKERTEYHLMPWYDFTYEVTVNNDGSRDTTFAPLLTDPEKCNVVFRDTKNEYPFIAETVNETRPSRNCSMQPYERPLTKFDFSYTDIAIPGYNPMSYSFAFYMSDFSLHEQTYKTTDVTMFLNDQRFTGKIYTAPQLHNTWPRNGVIFREAFWFPFFDQEKNISIEGYKNGRKDGISGNLQIVPEAFIPYQVRDLKAYFFRHPEWCDTYTEYNYSNGKLNGTSKAYSTASGYENYFEDFAENFFYRRVPHLFYETNYLNDTLHGEYKTFFPTGEIKSQAFFDKGLLNGKALTYARPGLLRSEATYKNGKLDGACKQYLDSVLVGVCEFRDGLVHGEVTEYNKAPHLPYISLRAEHGLVRERKMFFPVTGALKELVTFDQAKAYKCNDYILHYSNILAVAGIDQSAQSINASVQQFYENGNVMAEGRIENGEAAGEWKFRNENNMVTNTVFFRDTFITHSGSEDKTHYIGKIQGYYNNGRKRCEGLLLDFSTDYDCNSKQDKAEFEIVYSDFWTYEGKQTVSNGNGIVKLTDENGVLLAEGELKNMMQEGLWKYYDPNGKLNSIGYFINGEKDGLWYDGDLEGLNFEDAACFDPKNERAQKAFEYSKKVLSFTKTLYRNGEEISSTNFETDLNTQKLDPSLDNEY